MSYRKTFLKEVIPHFVDIRFHGIDGVGTKSPTLFVLISSLIYFLVYFGEICRELARNGIEVVNRGVGVRVPPYAELYKKPGLSDRMVLGLYRSYRNLLQVGNTQTPPYQSKA